MTAADGSLHKPRHGAGGPLETVREALRERAAPLTEFGYRPVDAEFLAAAALLGGYFVRRQYLAYVGRRQGRADDGFLRTAESGGHAAAVVGRSLFRLKGASLYRSIRCEEGLARRAAGWATVKKRLLALDYFLEARPEGTWLLSVSDKAEYFASIGIPEDRFPVAVRRGKGSARAFADGFPVIAASGERPEVSFSFAHTGATGAGMRRQLRLHDPLAAALASRGVGCEWVMLADSPGQFPRLRHAWRLWHDRARRDWRELELFTLRRLVERRDWGGLSRERVERYAALLAACSGKGADSRYRKWLEKGAPPRGPGEDFASLSRYREVLLDHDYSIAERVIR